MDNVFVGRPLPIYLDPELDSKNLAQLIATEARRKAKEQYDSEHIISAEARLIRYEGCPEIKNIFKIRFHYCCKDRQHTGWNQKYEFNNDGRFYSISPLTDRPRSEIPCH